MREIDHVPRGIFDETHHQFRKQVRRFYAEEIEPNIGAWEEAGIFDRNIFYKAADAGILCPGIPEEYGGGGGDLLHMAVCYEEHGYSPAGASMDSGLDTDASAYIILVGGTEEQKRTWLPKFANGSVVAEGLLTEPHSGSDLGAMRTTARKEGESYVINGAKAWITNASHLDLCLLAATIIDGDAKPRVGLFLVDAATPGVSKGKPFQTMLRGCSVLGEVFFDDVRVDESCLLGGPEGSGLGPMARVLGLTRLLYAARSVASSELAYQMARDFTGERQGFGKTLLDLPSVKARLAQVKMRIAVARAFVDKCLVEANEGWLTPERSSMAKLWCTEMEVEVSDICAHLHGAMGYSNEHPISKIVAAARGHRYAMGVSEMQLETIMRGL
ncbi:MAG: acyl-CoA dehydrogenase family protein [Porticoccaceae bacterium]